MRKYRSWLMGLGIGLILGASMLQLILLAQKQTVIVEQETISPELLKDEAKKAGFMLLTEAQLKATVDAAVSAAQDKMAENQKLDETIESGDVENKADDASSEAVPSAIPVEQQETVTLYVKYGMSFTEVAKELQKLGVIDNAEDFIVKGKSISKKMTVGNAVFTGKPSYRHIMDELTRKK